MAAPLIEGSSERPLKVVFFDYWTLGLHNFAPLIQPLRERGAEVMLLHLGSWRDPKVPRHEVIDGVLCRDITFYGSRLLRKAIEHESPDLILLLNTTLIMDRVAILSARGVGSRSAFLMHGSRASGEDLDRAIPIFEETRNRQRWSRIPKYASRVVPNYVYTHLKAYGLRALVSREMWHYLSQLALRPARTILRPPVSDSAVCDLALVYGEADRDLYVGTYGYPRDRVRLTGVPPLDRAFRLKNDPPTAKEIEEFLEGSGLEIPPGWRLVTCLESGFVEAGYQHWTDAGRIDYLRELADACRQAQCVLVIKTHPTTDVGPLQEGLAGYDHVYVVASIDLSRLIWASHGVVGHTSTTVMTAVALDRPVLTPGWGLSKGLPNWYVDHHVATVCDSPGDMTRRLADLAAVDAEQARARSAYLQRQVTLTDGRAVERIVDAVLEQAAIRRQQGADGTSGGKRATA